MEIWQAIVLAIIEGITEFLPVSSTGHMIIASSFMGIASNSFVKMFTVAIQFGAILSVIVLYKEKFFKSIDFYLKLFIAFLPAAIIGFLLNDYIDAWLENVWVVAISLLIGGLFLLFVDRIFATEQTVKEINYLMALKIGFFQVIAMLPGISRSAATIIGGLQQKLNRKQAAEFSFFLAVPTMFAATVYKMYKFQKDHVFSNDDLLLLFIGNMVAFVVAMVAIKAFITFLTKHGFKAFGYYRIALGLILLILLFAGVDLQIL